MAGTIPRAREIYRYIIHAPFELRRFIIHLFAPFSHPRRRHPLNSRHPQKKTSLPERVLFFISISGRRERSGKPAISCILQYVYTLHIHIYTYPNIYEFLYVRAGDGIIKS